MPYRDKDQKNANAREQWRRRKEKKLADLGIDPGIISAYRVNLKSRENSSLPHELLLEMLPEPGESKADHLKRRNRLRMRHYNSLLSPEDRRERNEKARNFYTDNHEKIRRSRNTAYTEDPDRFRQYNLKYFQKNKDVRLEKLATWALKNPSKLKEAKRRWAKENPEIFLASTAKCRAQILLAAPIWVNWAEIRKIYSKSANHNRNRANDLWQVDHIIPLNSPNVCGLHVPWNLRIITATDNRKKGNRWNPEDGIAPMT